MREAKIQIRYKYFFVKKTYYNQNLIPKACLVYLKFAINFKQFYSIKHFKLLKLNINQFSEKVK